MTRVTMLRRRRSSELTERNLTEKTEKQCAGHEYYRSLGDRVTMWFRKPASS